VAIIVINPVLQDGAVKDGFTISERQALLCFNHEDVV
jgi:hypothetical protein